MTTCGGLKSSVMYTRKYHNANICISTVTAQKPGGYFFSKIILNDLENIN